MVCKAASIIDCAGLLEGLLPGKGTGWAVAGAAGKGLTLRTLFPHQAGFRVRDCAVAVVNELAVRGGGGNAGVAGRMNGGGDKYAGDRQNICFHSGHMLAVES